MAEGTVQGGMTTEFTELAEDMSLNEGLARLRASPTPLAIVTDSVGAPQVLATVQDLEGAVERAVGGADLTLAEVRRWLPPLLVVRTRDASLSAIVDSPQITLLARGARGLVVTEGSRAMGVLPIQVIKAYLREHLEPGRFSSELPGDPVTLAGSAVCDLCGALNELELLDPDHLPWCANRQEPDPGMHRFKPGWLQP